MQLVQTKFGKLLQKKLGLQLCGGFRHSIVCGAVEAAKTLRQTEMSRELVLRVHGHQKREQARDPTNNCSCQQRFCTFRAFFCDRTKLIEWTVFTWWNVMCVLCRLSCAYLPVVVLWVRRPLVCCASRQTFSPKWSAPLTDAEKHFLAASNDFCVFHFHVWQVFQRLVLEGFWFLVTSGFFKSSEEKRGTMLLCSLRGFRRMSGNPYPAVFGHCWYPGESWTHSRVLLLRNVAFRQGSACRNWAPLLSSASVVFSDASWNISARSLFLEETLFGCTALGGSSWHHDFTGQNVRCAGKQAVIFDLPSRSDNVHCSNI